MTPPTTGDQDDERAPSARRREDVGVVGEGEMAGEEEVVQQADQVAKQHRADSRHDSQRKAQQGQTEQTHSAGFVFDDCAGRGRGDAEVGGVGPHDGFRFGCFLLIAPSPAAIELQSTGRAPGVVS